MMLKTYDWIIVGGGITGGALAYELVKQGFAVLLLEQHTPLQGATRYSYGGMAYWSGTTELTKTLNAEGRARHRILADELAGDTQFRELDLLLTIATDDDPKSIAATYAHFAIPPHLLSVKEACDLEPLLNPQAIAAALTVKHGHIQPEMTAQAYIRAFLRQGGVMEVTTVLGLLQVGSKITGVKTTSETYHSANVIIAAGGLSRHILKAVDIPIRLYFTHAELIETPAVDVQLRTLVMPAQTKRFQLEAEATTLFMEKLWDEPGNEPVPPILDAGAIQFLDGSLRLGQVSRVLTDPNAAIDPNLSEATIRRSVGQVLPLLKDLPGTWHHCLVAFSCDGLPLIGSIPGFTGLHVFSGFGNAFVIVPPLAQRFANWVITQKDDFISQLSPSRFLKLKPIPHAP